MLTANRKSIRAVSWAAAGLLAVMGGPAFGQGSVDLRTWSQEGDPGAGTWNVAPDGLSVLQTVNGAPTFFVSPLEYINTTVKGSLGVETTGDDDFIGFVFGYSAPIDPCTATRYCDFILLDWKQLSQSGASAGFRLSKVEGTHNGIAGIGNQLWLHESDASMTCTSLGAPLANAGWADNTVYEFELSYQESDIEIYIQGGSGTFATRQKIFDVSISDLPGGTFEGDVFPEGRFGFYNHSQSSVRYRGFSRADDPILITDPDNGGTLALGSVRVGTTSAPGSLTITNGATVGSLLTGTVSAAGGEFSGPLPDQVFSLQEQESTVRTFTYTPAGRGADSQDITVDSNAGLHTIALSGTGVGPIFDSSITPGSLADFGTIDKDDTATLPLDLSNVTPDPGGDALTGLTLDFEITGPDAAMFSLDLTPDTVVSSGQTLNLTLTFDPGGVEGVFGATLTLLTDQGAAFGETALGDPFVFNLTGESIPEPATILLTLCAFAPLLGRRKRH